MMRPPVRIACGADDRFALPMAVTLSSALRSLGPGRRAEVHVFDGGISGTNRSRISDVVRRTERAAGLHWTVPDVSVLEGVRTTRAINAAAYLRLLLPSALPDHLERVIYLDSDTVVRRDLGHLFDHPFEGHSTLGVRDYYTPTVTSVGGLDERAAQFGIPPDAPYCNSGVLVLNLPVWRAERLAEQAFEYTRSFRDVMNRNDQEAINAVVAGGWGLLDPRWNVTLSSVGSYERKETAPENIARECLRSDPWIIHYTSPAKPWHYGAGLDGRRVLYYQSRERDLFLDALRESGWFSSTQYRVWAGSRRAWLASTYKLPRRLHLIDS